ncbi:hypothetical protein BC941DRAFT_217394 [Chlamydoabsidia padenii]|nr:hypothetical protein BC941DRAFT_217394 [Chlamydoabsidia padenii]
MLLLFCICFFPQEKPTDQQMDAESSSQEHATPDIITKEEVRLMEEDHDLNYELYRGNTFAVGRLRSERYIFIPCGTHLTELRIVQLAHGRIKREGLFDNTIWINHPNSMAFGDLQTKVCLDLQDPIQQITVSSAIDVLKAEQSLMIIAVRTMSKTLLIKVERKKDDEPLTTSYLHEFVSPSPLVRPAHITPSPYTGQQYAMVDDNGSIFIYDIYSLHPLKLKQKENLNKRWISCIFGPNSRSLIVASSTEVTMLEYSADGGKLPRRLLFKCSSEDQQIHCLGGLDIRNSFLFCVGTDDYILLMDTRYPNQPVICWKHYLFDDPPRFMQLFKDKNDPDLGEWKKRKGGLNSRERHLTFLPCFKKK